MPTLQIMSDLHLEFLGASSIKFIEDLEATGADILVLAGDIDVGVRLDQTLRVFAAKWPQVVFVPGNHEFYHHTPNEVRQVLLRLAADLPNFTWLDNKPAVVDGVRFVGGTLWFRKPPPGPVWDMRLRMNDYRVIRDFEPWVYDENLRCEAMLRSKAKDTTVVVTHHLPSVQAIAPQYAGNVLNHYFCHDLTELIELTQPPLWIFGHTHTAMDFMIGQTRLVCNPKGYPGEREPAFNPRLLVTV